MPTSSVVKGKKKLGRFSLGPGRASHRRTVGSSVFNEGFITLYHLLSSKPGVRVVVETSRSLGDP
jgi:hypothetical protein